MKAPDHILDICVDVSKDTSSDVYLLSTSHFQMENLKKAASEDDKIKKEDKQQAEVYESHSKFMKSKVGTRHLYREEVSI